jgi:HK97 family phage prohead protease
MRRAYSTIQLKRIDGDAREFTGIASTPSTDMVGDIVEPTGAVYKMPIPLLWQHDQGSPVGEISQVKVSASGIAVRGTIFKATESRTLMERLDEAWESIKIGLVRGLSIGFSPIDYEPIKGERGYKFTKWAWHELSAVTVPANSEATISTIKSLDRDLLAASGRKEGVIWLGEQHRRDCRKSDVFYLKRDHK